MSENFIVCLKRLLNIEGGYVNNKHDLGGETNYGITSYLAKKYNKDVKNLTFDDVKEIYYNEFWKPLNLDLIENPDIAYEPFEFFVNSGKQRLSIKLLQRAYNLLQFENFIKEDGLLGKNTAKALNSYRYPKSLIKVYNHYQAMYYIGITEEDENLLDDLYDHEQKPGNKRMKYFIRGWIDKRT